MKNVTAEDILNTLEKQRFADWYNNGRFDSYICGDLPKISKEEILDDVKKMFNIP